MLHCLIASSALVLQPQLALRPQVRASVVLSESLGAKVPVESAVDSVAECLIEAENAAEQADCLTTPAAPSAAAQAAAVAVDECIVEAENAAEIFACSDTTIGTTVEECVVNAENAAEHADCLTPVAAAEAPTTSMDQDNLE